MHFRSLPTQRFTLGNDSAHSPSTMGRRSPSPHRRSSSRSPRRRSPSRSPSPKRQRERSRSRSPSQSRSRNRRSRSRERSRERRSRSRSRGRSDRGGRDSRGGGRYGGDERPRPQSLLVRNLSANTSADALRRAFSRRAGDIRDVYMPKDFSTNLPRGFAFIEFNDSRDAREIKQEMDRTLFEGREIAVLFAQQKRKTPDEMRALVSSPCVALSLSLSLARAIRWEGWLAMEHAGSHGDCYMMCVCVCGRPRRSRSRSPPRRR